MRIYSIINYMLENDRYVTLTELSEYVNMSVPTIRLDLVKVEEIIDKVDANLIRKRGVGIKIEYNESSKSKLIQMIDSKMIHKNEEITTLDTEILKILIREKSAGTTISSIADELFMSEFPVQKSLDKLKILLKKYDIELIAKQGKGIVLEGNEVKIRKLSSNIHFTDYDQSKYFDPINIKNRIMNSLGVDPTFVMNAIIQMEKQLDIKFSDESFQSLLIHISIALNRVFSGSQITTDIINDGDVNDEIYSATQNLYEQIEKLYNVDFNEAELYYGYLHIISTGVSTAEINMSSLVDIVDANIVKIANHIKELVQSILNITVSEKNFNNLVLHLRPMINRLEHNMQIKNPLLENIKREYPEAYGIAWMCNPIFVREFDCDVSEDEVAYIALHIQAMIDNVRQELNVVIVCSSGIGVSQLLKSQIESRIKNLNIVGTYSITEFERTDLSNIDFVISTFPLETSHSKVIVNSILEDDDISKIKNFINNPNFNNPQKAIVHKLYKDKNWNSKKEVLESINFDLVQRNEVEEQYLESLFEREDVGSTEIGNYIALPHGDFNYVKKSQIIFVTLTNKIKWDEYDVDVVIFIVLKEEDTKIISPKLKRLYKNIPNKEFREHIRSINKVEELKLQ